MKQGSREETTSGRRVPCRVEMIDARGDAIGSTHTVAELPKDARRVVLDVFERRPEAERVRIYRGRARWPEVEMSRAACRRPERAGTEAWTPRLEEHHEAVATDSSGRELARVGIDGGGGRGACAAAARLFARWESANLVHVVPRGATPSVDTARDVIGRAGARTGGAAR